MSDPVTNMQIEDVLSSIRKLVSEEVRTQTKVRTEAAEPEKLILTPQLRVAEAERAAPDTWADDDGDHGDDDAAHAEDHGPEDDGESGAVSDTDLAAADDRGDEDFESDDVGDVSWDDGDDASSEESWAPEFDVSAFSQSLRDDAAEPAGDAPEGIESVAFLQSSTSDDQAARDLADLYHADEDADDDGEPDDAAEAAAPAGTALLFGTTRSKPLSDDFEDEGDNAETLETADAFDDRPDDVGLEDDEFDDDVPEGLAALDEAIGDLGLDEEPEETAAVPPFLKDRGVGSMDARLAEMPETMAAATGDVLPWEDHLDAVEDDEFDDDLEIDAEPESEADDLAAIEAPLIDEDMLRDMVSEIVRQELQGALGERITRNVRKLVRREIHRALTSNELL